MESDACAVLPPYGLIAPKLALGVAVRVVEERHDPPHDPKARKDHKQASARQCGAHDEGATLRYVRVAELLCWLQERVDARFKALHKDGAHLNVAM